MPNERGPDPAVRKAAGSADATPAAALAVRNLSVAYGARDYATVALQAVDLSVRPGEILGITGSGGSGKSTLAHALLGMARAPGRITAGQVYVEGRDLLQMSPAEQESVRGKQVALIVQNPRACLDPLTRVGAQIGRVWRAHHKRGSGAPRRQSLEAVALLRLVGINDPERRAQAFAHELSGGMAQRVLIAMALSGTPRVLIADEPTSGLDVTIQAQFLDLMWRRAREEGMALVLITQEPGILMNYCDRVLVMAQGRIAEDLSARGYHRTHLTGEFIPAVPPPVGSSCPGAKIIAVRGLFKQFPLAGGRGVVHAVEDVSFDILPGETFGLVGESGSGKTTVGRCMLGLETPTRGSIIFRGEPLSGRSRREVRRLRAKLQAVLQDPRESLDPRWIIGDSVREPLDLHTSLGKNAKRARVEELLRWVGCEPHVIDLKPASLASGELQRINVARALATDPEFIVLDEPTSQLAPRARTGLAALLNRLQSERKLAYLFISHDLSSVRQICHRIAVMYLGQIVELAGNRQLFETPRHPYTKALMHSHLGCDPEHRRVDVPKRHELQGEIPSPVDLPLGCHLASRCPAVEASCRQESQILREVSPGHWVRCRRAEVL